MALRNLFYEEDEILRKKAKPVTEINEKTIQLIEDMFETMEENNGVGLAAPQVGMLKSIIVIDFSNEKSEEAEEAGEEKKEEIKKYELINPVLVDSEGEIEGNEGCLSIPGKTGRVVRPEKVRIKAYNRFGEEITVEGEGLLARILCHELDHLNGILYTDIASEVKEIE